MSKRKQWKHLSPGARVGMIGAILVQIALLGAALRDLRARPADEVRGPKGLWMAVAFINYVGPLAYFLVGRKPATRTLPA